MNEETMDGDQTEFAAVEELLQETQVETPVADIDDDVPAKYRNKSPAELARIAAEQEKFIGRQAQEVGEVRRLADELIKSQLQANKQPVTPQPVVDPLSDVDFFADPVNAVKRAVDSHPAVLQAQAATAQMRQTQAMNRLASNHPDYQEVVKDPDFLEWVGKSKVRQNLYMAADRAFDVDAAEELLGTYKEVKQIRHQVVTDGAAQLRESQNKALKAASVPAGTPGETSKKVYRRADLIQLQLTNPDRYLALQDEILAAYSEGRVK
jgi:hypothetical protein